MRLLGAASHNFQSVPRHSNVLSLHNNSNSVPKHLYRVASRLNTVTHSDTFNNRSSWSSQSDNPLLLPGVLGMGIIVCSNNHDRSMSHCDW